MSSLRPALQYVLEGRRTGLLRVATAAFVGGLAEALFLVAITRAAFAITAGNDRVGVLAGRFLPLEATLGLALVLVTIRVVLAVYASALSARLGTSVVATVREDLSSAFLDASWEAQQHQRAGSLQELLTSYSGHASALITSVSQAVVAVGNLTALIGIAVAVDPVGAAMLIGAVALLGTLLRPLRRMVRRRSGEAASAGMDFATSVNEISRLGLELHVFGAQEAARRRVAELVDRAREKSRRVSFATSVATPLYLGLAYLALVGALGVAAASDATNLTSLAASMLVMLRSLSYGQSLQAATTNISASVPPIDALRDTLAMYRRSRREDDGAHIGRLGPVSADRVAFRYGDDEGDVLSDITFTIEPREIVGVIGPSGAGKTTLVHLLLGLRAPTAGQILADGRDIGGFARAEWCRQVTFVPQDPQLIEGTIADNIAFFRDVPKADIERAARLAHLDEQIREFAQGYDRWVGGEGAALSGGQRQRLCIARALVEDPQLLILDEPTSALDVRSEQLLRQTLLDLRARMTVVVIAHRLSTLDICDRIMVIQDGEVKAFDRPDVLASSNAFYSEALSLSGLI